MQYEIQRVFNLPKGGTVKVTVGSEEPIKEEDFMLLRPDAAIAMSECMMDFADAMKPLKPKGKP